MDFLGFSLQEFAIVFVTLAILVFQIRMFVDVWRGQLRLLFKLIWSAVIIGFPVLGAVLYWWFVKAGKIKK